MGSNSLEDKKKIAVLKTLSPSELKLLLEIHERSHPELGTDIREVGLRRDDRFIRRMLGIGILKVSYVSSKYFQVKLNVDPEIVMKFYKEKTRPIDLEEVRRLLDEYVIGMDEIKELVVRVINCKEWLLLVGKPATGKSMILDALKRLPRTIYIHGVSAKKRDILELVLESDIEVVLIDEVDKIHNMVIESLTELWDYIKYNDIDLAVIGTANDMSKLSNWVLSRFMVVEVPELSLDTIIKVVEKETGVSDREVIERLWSKYRDLRQVIKRIKAYRDRLHDIPF